MRFCGTAQGAVPGNTGDGLLYEPGRERLRIGTTEGRFRMIMPDLIAQMAENCPGVLVDGHMADAVTLREQLLRGELDLAFSGLTPDSPPEIAAELLLDEKLYYVISGHLLLEIPESDRERTLRKAEADLRVFAQIPVMRSLPHLHCMQILDEVLSAQDVQLPCVHVSPHYDLHQELAVRDYAACFCLGMYLPHLYRLNGEADDLLHVFRIRGLEKTNPVYLLYRKEQPWTEGMEMFTALLRQRCAQIAALQERI